ncbi:MAG: hypothetical protein M3Z27_07405 [Actinomycetota bacterium]|nr:hypothetical protein [Actinomycetota bacterium]
MGAVALVTVLLGLSGCGGGASHTHAAAGRRPAGPLIGAMFDGPVLGPRVDLGRQLDLAVSSGVESLRVAVDWASAQPYRTLIDVPSAQRASFTDVGGVPTRFGDLDRVASAAAARGLSLLPVVLSTPHWAAGAGGSISTPPRPAAYAAFVGALVRRYGPHGSFWSSHPKLPAVPVRMWQVWNEPDFTRYWSVQPFAPTYVKVLAAAHAAIKRADPEAQVVLAGLPEVSWQYLAQIYAVPGARAVFDTVAVHPYTARPAGVIEILGRVRAVMDRAGDARKPLLATEITWPSSQGHAPPQFGVGTTEAGQARLLAQVMPLLEQNRARLGLSGFYWYTWMGDESARPSAYAFDYAGLLGYGGGRVVTKPALAVFRRWALALEHCARKDASASDCG